MMEEKEYFTNYESPIGIIQIHANSSGIISLKFAEKAIRESDQKTSNIDSLLIELDEYFKGNRDKFDIPVSIDGTLFQQKVWDAVSKIEYGKTKSYLDLSKGLKATSAIRAVAAANARNKLLLLIPCHRIIGADGSMVGYAGGLSRKKWLLNHEAKYSGSPTLF